MNRTIKFNLSWSSYRKNEGFLDSELAVWRTFWSGLFKLAKDRGIDTYLVHCVNSATDDKYLKESVTQLINEYQDLTELGVTLGEGMNNWTATEREEWRTQPARILKS